VVLTASCIKICGNLCMEWQLLYCAKLNGGEHIRGNSICGLIYWAFLLLKPDSYIGCKSEETFLNDRVPARWIIRRIVHHNNQTWHFIRHYFRSVAESYMIYSISSQQFIQGSKKRNMHVCSDEHVPVSVKKCGRPVLWTSWNIFVIISAVWDFAEIFGT